jgi:hypothetical protein
MAYNGTVTIPAQAWTQITAGDVTALRAQPVGFRDVWLMGTVGATPPTSTGGGLLIKEGSILSADLSLADLFPGVAATRVYAYCEGETKVSVSHA